MNRITIFGLLVGWMLLSAPPVFSTDTSKRPRSVLEGVKVLEKPVTYTEAKIPLSELVQKVAEDTGVRLSASKEVADEPVAVVVKEMPARELLDQLADLLDYHWSRWGKEGAWRYEIWQNLASKQREEALRHALLDGVNQRFTEELSACQEVAALPPEEIQRLAKTPYEPQGQTQNLTPEQRQALLDSPEEQARRRRITAAHRVRSPIPRALARLSARFTQAQWASLQAEAQIVFSSDPRPGEVPLPADILQVFRSSRPSLLPSGMKLPPDSPMAQREQGMQREWASADAYHVTARFTWNYPSPGRISLGLRSLPVKGGQRLDPIYDGPAFGIRVEPQEAPLELPDAPDRPARLAEDPVVGTPKPLVLDAVRRRELASPPLFRAYRTLQDLLPDLARAYGVSFIADSYWTAARIDNQLPGNERVPLFALLDRYTRRFGRRYFVWDRRGTLIRIRSLRWFMDRPSEIPLRYVRRWMDLCDRFGALPLDEYGALARSLSELQVRALDTLWANPCLPPPLSDDLKVVDAGHNLLRLYGGLTPGQRDALQRGAAVPVAQMAPRLWPLIQAGLNRIARYQYPLQPMDEWLAGSFSIPAEPAVRVRAERDGVVSYRTDAVAGGAALSVSAAPSPVGSGSVRQYLVTQVRLRIEPGGGRGPGLTVARLPSR